jgi:outer membrane protein assembly factor BamB
MKKIVTLLLIISSTGLLACGGANSRTEGSVIQWRGDRQGVFHETGLLTSWTEEGPELLWYFDGLGEGHSSPAIANNKIFIKGMNEEAMGVIFALDLNGNLLNSRVYGEEWNRSFHGTRGTITPSGDNIYFISGLGVIYAYEQRSLNLIWSRDMLEEFDAPNTLFGICESPLIVGDKVIATPGGAEYNVVAFNKHTGELVWSTPGMGDRSTYSSALFIDDQEVPLIVQMTGNHALGIHADTGELLWAFPKTNRLQLHADTPVYSSNMILLTSGYGQGSIMLRLIDGGRGVEKVWSSNEVLESQMGGVIRVGDYIFGSGHRVSPYWQCVNWYTGEVMWRERLGEPNMGSIIFADGLLFLYTSSGDVKLVRPNTEKFDVVSQFTITKGDTQFISTPIIYNGVLFLRRGNTLMAYNIRKENENS